MTTTESSILMHSSTTELDIGSSLDQVTLVGSTSQYSGLNSKHLDDLEIDLLRRGGSVRESVIGDVAQASGAPMPVNLSPTQQITQTSTELTKEGSIRQEIFGQSSTQQTAKISTDLTTEKSVDGATTKESSVRYGNGAKVTILRGDSEETIRDIVMKETVRESTQIHGQSSTLKNIQTSFQSAVENTSVSYGGQVVKGLNVAVQPREDALEFVGTQESMQEGIQLTQLTAQTSSELKIDKSTALVSFPTSSGSDMGKVYDITTIRPVIGRVQETVVGMTVQDSTKESSGLSTQVTSQTSVASEIVKGRPTVREIIGQHDGLSVGGAIEELSGSTTQQTIETSTESVTQTSTQQTAQASAGQTVQAFTELDIQESTNCVQEITESLTEKTAQTLPQQTSQILTLAGKVVRQSEFTKEIGQSPIILTAQVEGLTNYAFATLGGATVGECIRGSGIRLSVGEEGHLVSKSEGEEDSTTVDEQAVAATIQRTATLSFEAVQASTESAAYVQSSTQETSTALATTGQVAVTESEQYRREQSVDIVPSSAHNISNLAIQETVQGMTVEVVADESKSIEASSVATGVNIQSSEFTSFHTK